MAPKKRNNQAAPSPDRTMILVLGMHRSGTSALAGLLHTIDYAAPKTLMPATQRNPAGHFESQAIFEFNEQLLHKAGSSWKDWRNVDSAWFTSDEGRAAQVEAQELLVSEFEDAARVVLKDPRICKMVPFWTEAAQAVGFHVLPVLTRRNPLEVVQSLQSRDAIVPAEGMLIWLRHMLSAEFATRKTQRFLTSYDAVLHDGPGQLAKMGKTFGIKMPRRSAALRKKMEAFLSADLRHFEVGADALVEDKTISQWVHTTHDIFERWSKDGEAKADYLVLDRIRREFDKAAPVFAQALGQQKTVLTRALDDRTRQVKTAHARLKTTRAEAERLKSHLDTRAKQIEQHSKMQKQLRSELRKTKQQADTLQSEIGEFSRILANRQSQIRQGEESRKALRDELDTYRAQLAKQQSDYRKLAAEADEFAHQLSDLSREKKQLKQTLIGYQKQIADQATQIVETGASNEKLQQELADQQATRARLEDALKAQDEVLQNLASEKEALGATLEHQQKQVAEREITIEGLQQALEAKQNDLDHATAALQQEREHHHDTAMQVHKSSAEGVVLRAELQAKSLQSQSLQDLLEQRDRDFEALQTELQTLRGNLSTTESALIQRQLETEETLKRAQVAEHDLNETDAYLRDLLNLLREMHGVDAVQEYNKNLMSWPDVVAGLKTEVAALSKTVSSEREISKTYKEKHEAAQNALSSSETIRKNLAATLKETDAALMAKVEQATQQNAQQSRKIEQQSEQIATLSARVATLDKALSERTREVDDARQAHNNQMAELLAKTDETHRNNERQASEIAELAKALATAEEQLASRAQETADLQAQNTTHQEKLSQAEQQIAEMGDVHTALRAIENSTFWRMTKPLRKIVDTLRGAN